MQAPLPESESLFLNSLPLLQRCRRIQELCGGEGWSLQSVANAFTPPRRRSTIRMWLLRPLDDADLSTYYALNAVDAFSAPQLPHPPQKAFRFHPLRPHSSYPHLSRADLRKIARLSPLARKYRSRSRPGSPSQVANEALSQLAAELFNSGVRVSELARAASVTYRAMKCRLEKYQAQHPNPDESLAARHAALSARVHSSRSSHSSL